MSSRYWVRTSAGSRPSFATTSSTSPLPCSNSISTSSGDELMERSYGEPRRRRKKDRVVGRLSTGIYGVRLRKYCSLLVDHFEPLERERVSCDAHVALARPPELADLAVGPLHGALEALVALFERPVLG